MPLNPLREPQIGPRQGITLMSRTHNPNLRREELYCHPVS